MGLAGAEAGVETGATNVDSSTSGGDAGRVHQRWARPGARMGQLAGWKEGTHRRRRQPLRLVDRP